MNRKHLFLFLTAFLISAAPLSRSEYSGTDTCAACHEDIYEEFNNSIHSKAYSNEAFQKSWEEHQKNPDCLACHTTGHKKGTAEYAEAGVNCEACHGAMSEGHPDTAKMPIPAGPEMCQNCHKKTFQEWQLSKHAEKNIRCYDCHQVHAQGLRAGGGDQLCGSCHENRLTDFAHSTHHMEGLKCSTCHMPDYKSHGSMIEGTGASAHTLSVGAEVCSRCHEDMVHKSAAIPSLREKVTEMNQQMVVAGVDNVFDLSETNKNLEWKLARVQQGLAVAALLFFLIGLLIGWLGGWYLYAKKRKSDSGPGSGSA